jgi:S1-C subfamily serine protease
MNVHPIRSVGVACLAILLAGCLREDEQAIAPAAASTSEPLVAALPAPLAGDDVARSAAPAVALVLRQGTNIVVTAFCVDASGVFVTHERVGQYGGDKGLRVILQAGTSAQRELKGKIIHSEKTSLETGLALVRVDDAKDLPTLSLGRVPAGTETFDLTSIGYPFTVGAGPGAALPAARFQTGKGTPVWQNGDELTGLKHDRSLGVGSYGAPLLDSGGQVVGVLTPDETALPVTRIHRLLAKAGVELTAAAEGRPPAAVREQAPGKEAAPAQAPPLPTPGKPLSGVEIGRLGKAATALVEVQATRSTGSAFCIHPSGLFVTNEHVVRLPPAGGLVNLILNPGEKGQRVLQATVVRSDRDQDLALLRAAPGGTFAAVTLGSADELSELMEVVAFGFPFGKGLAVARGDYPAVSVNAGRVTSLRRKDGELQRVQLDAALNPGNSGGPVLDHTGRVVGVVVSGVRVSGGASGVNFAIPVNHVRRFLAKPDLHFTPPALTRVTLHQPVVFEARAAQLLPGAAPLTVELILTTPDKMQRRHKMELKEGIYRAHVPAIERPVPKATVPVMVRFATGSLRGTADDQPFTLDGKTYRLRDVLQVSPPPKPTVTFQDGRAVEGAPAGLETVPVRLGGQEVRVDLRRAVEVRVQGGTVPESVTATVVVLQDGREVGRTSATLSVPGVLGASLPEPAPVATPAPPSPKDAAAIEANKVERRLPGTLSDVVVGGGGRFLILCLPQLRQLAVFDTYEARVIHYVRIAEEGVKFAAGIDKLLVALPESGVLQRWSLTTFEREATVPLPVSGKLLALCMGSASHGPLLIGTENQPLAFVNITTFRPLPVRAQQGQMPGAGAFLHASADGKTFGMRPGVGGEPHGVTLLTLRGEEVVVRSAGMASSVLVPGPDGRLVYTGSGIYNDQMELVHPKPLPPNFGKAFVPALHGNYYMRLDPKNGDQLTGDLEFFLPGNDQPLARLDNVEGVSSEQISYGSNRDKLTHDQRVHFIPNARRVIAIPRTNDRLVVHRFDLEEAMEKSGVDYLVVTSDPPRTAKRGETYVYGLTVKAKKGGLKYKLESGPKGMALSAEGQLTWVVPRDFEEKEVAVIIAVQDATGQECFHTFSVGVRE